MEPLLWTCVLGLLSTLAVPTKAESIVVSQSPKVIALMKVNSTAEIRCRSTILDPAGLFLRRRYSKDMEVLYYSFHGNKLSVNSEYQNRLSVNGKCCDFTLRLSQLRVEDTDGYYCRWSQVDEKTVELKYYQSNDTIIIIRERDPKEDCNRSHILHHILFLLSVTVSVVVVCVFIGVLVWWCTRTKESYKPARVNKQHRCLHSQQRAQRHIYPII
ncbi:hypothetical protein MATL_G00006770 [Megalops atlanticus]|uniref:Immunoglobulin V-set domain-containing protein n=1 Tax=Megalops atlanticus TaxID=7932 RepID=A0A9D3TDJ7_MEGAT|nr:hypothetical protein MATL_G00006770 [Megalops atlanticus]